MNATDPVSFDLYVGNTRTAIVEIRADLTREDRWLYEITDSRPDRLIRGTLTWTGTDHLDLIRSVLADHLSAHPKSAVI